LLFVVLDFLVIFVWYRNGTRHRVWPL